jgi:hypothetical protein
MIKQKDTHVPSPLEEVQRIFDQKLFARTHTTHFLPERSAARGDYTTSGDLDDLFAHFQAVHELHCNHKREGLPPPRF